MMRSKSPAKTVIGRSMAKPLPHLVDGNKWKVKKSKDLSITFRQKHEMHTSFGGDKVSRYLRFKEMLSVMYGIQMKEGMEKSSYAEGCRLNLIAQKVGLADDMQLSFIDDIVRNIQAKAHKVLLKEDSYVNYLKTTIISLHPFSAPILDALGKRGKDKEIRSFVKNAPLIGDIFSSEFTEKLTYYMRAILPTYDISRSLFRWAAPFGSDGDGDPDFNPFILESAKWGFLEEDFIPEMEIVVKPKVKGDKRAPKRCTQEGIIPLRWDRWPIDQNIFMLRKKIFYPIGSVLIDMSGSMGWSLSEIQSVILKCPTATVLGYRSNNSLRGGQIIVLGEKGKVSTSAGLNEYTRNTRGGNVVDGPALVRLSMMLEPRFWLSDGLVTGVNDTQNDELNEDANRVCSYGKIRRVEDFRTLTNLIKDIK